MQTLLRFDGQLSPHKRTSQMTGSVNQMTDFDMWETLVLNGFNTFCCPFKMSKKLGNYSKR